MASEVRLHRLFDADTDGGFTVLDLPSRDEAIAWAASIAKACRCGQELRVSGSTPQS